MHDRNMIWITNDGQNLKLKDITTRHLCNISKFIDKNLQHFHDIYGIKKTKRCKYNIEQEIRLRKLNKLNLVQGEDELF
jgi:hypothetical protein